MDQPESGLPVPRPVRRSSRYRLVAAAEPDMALLEPVEAGWRRRHLVPAPVRDFLASAADWCDPDWVLPSRLVAGLLMDGILETEYQGDVVSGPAAWAALFPAAGEPGSLAPDHGLEALRVTAATGRTDWQGLRDRLYRFGCLPASPAWRRRLPDDAAVARLIDVAAPEADPVLGGGELLVSFGGGAGTWRHWAASGTAAAAEARYKLYLSPAPEAVGEGCRMLLERLGAMPGPVAVKTGRNLEALLRPDKLVGYFTSFDALQQTAEWLLGHGVEALPAHGVPFTAPLGSLGILSWGVDPPRPRGRSLRRADSWRGWVTELLGAALAAALSEPSGVDPVRFAMDRLRLEGVDPGRWTPPTGCGGGHGDH